MSRTGWKATTGWLWCLMALLMTGCSLLPPKPEPPRISLVGVQLLQSELLELRYALKLRVRNPNDFPLRIQGMDFQMELNRMHFADGVSNAAVEVPAYGEALLQVEVSSSLWSIARQLRGFGEGGTESIPYRMYGRISMAGRMAAIPFSSEGSIPLGNPQQMPVQ